MRGSRTDIVKSPASVSAGDHVAHLVTGREERDRLFHAFLLAGIHAGQAVIYFGSQGGASELRRDLKRRDAQPAKHLNERQFRCVHPPSADTTDRADVCQTALQAVEDAIRQADRAGFTKIRMFSEPLAYFGNAADPELLLRFGAHMDILLRSHGIAGLCVFDEDADPSLLLSVLSTHPLLSRGGEVCENYHYLPPHVITSEHVQKEAYRYRIESLVERAKSDTKVRLLGAALQDLPDAVIVHDPGGTVLVWNRGAENLYGIPEQTALQSTRYDVVPEHERELLRDLLDNYGIDTTAAVFETTRTAADSRVIDVWVSASVIADSQDRPRAIIAIEKPLAEHLRTAPEEVLQSDQRFRTLLRNVEEYIYSLIYGRNGEVVSTYHSPKCKEITGYTPDQYENNPNLWFEMIHEQDRDRVTTFFKRLRETGGTGSIDHRLIRADKTVCWVSNTCTVSTSSEGTLERLDGFITDISERRKAEEQRLRAEQDIQEREKLESLAVLAGGIAHDFNNLLTVVIGNVDLVASEIARNDPARQHLNEVKQAAVKAARLAGEMLAFTGYGKPSSQTCDLSRSIASLEQVFRALAPAQVDVCFELSAVPLTVGADAAQIRKLCKNLLRNALEAVGTSGKITVRTGIMDADARYLNRTRGSRHATPGRYAWLDVQDTGCGVPEEIRSRIFDPFFSTNFTGRGLGLSVVHGIVMAHHGAILVDSSPQTGTTFRILFPTEPNHVSQASRNHNHNHAAKGGGTVLVVDDETSLVNLAKLVLERNGMTVHTAFNGMEGVERFRQHADDIDVVLLDLTMPVMNGVEAFRQIRSIKADTSVVFSSGYTDKAVELPSLPREDNVTFLQKPYTTQQLRGAVGKAMRARQPKGPLPGHTRRGETTIGSS